jgi:hypothetical protein
MSVYLVLLDRLLISLGILILIEIQQDVRMFVMMMKLIYNDGIIVGKV